MSQTTDALDVAGDDPSTEPARSPLAVASSDPGTTDEVVSAIDAGTSSREALRAAGFEAGPSVRWAPGRDAARTTAEPTMHEGSYRGHPVLVPGDGPGLDLLQALALLDAEPLADRAAADRAARVAHASAIAASEGERRLTLDARLDLDHLEALLDAEPPAAPAFSGPRVPVAAVLDRDGVASAVAAEGGLPFVVLRSGRPFVVASVRGQLVPGALTLLVRLLDEGRPLSEAVSLGPGSDAAVVLVEDDLARHAAFSGRVEGVSRVR